MTTRIAQPDIVRDIPVRELSLRCRACDKLLAEDITPPWRIKCKCGAVSEVTLGEALCLTTSKKG